MGIGGSKFKRNDKISGQGLQTLVDAKALKIKSTQLDRLFHEFKKFSNEDDNLMDYEGFLSYHEVDNSPMTDLLFMLVDKTKDGWWNFYQYMISMWNFLSTSDDNLPATLFTIFDIEGKGVLEVFECKYLLQLIYIFKPPIFARWAIDKLDLNEDGFCTIAEFVLLCRHHPVLLLPLVNMRKKIRKRVVHSRFWREIAYIRSTEFQSISYFDILVVKDSEDFKTRALEGLLTREDIPLEYKDKWKDIQAKKEVLHNTRDIITKDLPPETLTDTQMGLRTMYPVCYTHIKKKDQGAFSHLQTNYDDDAALQNDDDDANNERLNLLVNSLKAQHSRQQASSRRKSSTKVKSSHTSVKAVVPGIPTAAAPEPVGAQNTKQTRYND
jgi:Ca2+-binding EF-hand superfamily protein